MSLEYPGFWPSTALAVLALVSYYVLIIRPAIMHLGASQAEQKMEMPGDGLVIEPDLRYTQAITIKAPRRIVWSYLVQVGYRRAGWYNWDFFNLLSAKDYFYENKRSARRIIPELQELKPGDRISLTPAISMEVSSIEKRDHILLTGLKDGKYVVTWTFVLKRLDQDRTRLFVRWNSRLGKSSIYQMLNKLILEPGGVGIQQTGMLRGIKKRSEAEYALIREKKER